MPAVDRWRRVWRNVLKMSAPRAYSFPSDTPQLPKGGKRGNMILVAGALLALSAAQSSSSSSDARLETTTRYRDVAGSSSDAHVCSQKTPPLLTVDFINGLKKVLRAEQIELDDGECRQRGKPWNSYHKEANYPRVIVKPDTTEDVSEVLKLCDAHKIPVIAFGGGTSLEGQTLAPQGGLSLDFSNMKSILELNEDDLDITVQAGLGYVELNEILRQQGKKLWFPLDPGPGATIGGMCACRCSGSTAVRYGTMKDNVLNVTAVMHDGTIIKTGSRARKSAAGYDLTRLLIGSEGTLAVITEATLKLHGIPTVSYALRVSFPSVREAAATARDTLNCGVTVGRCELLDDTMIKIVNQTHSNIKPWPEEVTLLYEVTGISREAVAEQLQVVQAIAEKNGGRDVSCVTDEEEAKEMWSIRKLCLWSAMSHYPDREAMITDACVPLSKLPDLISQTREEIDSSPVRLPAPVIAHAGDGNFHVLLMIRPDVEADVREAKRIAGNIAIRAIEMGGTCTGEHGVGVGKKDFLAREMGPGSMKLMETIKKAVDPNGIMNPGKILDTR